MKGQRRNRLPESGLSIQERRPIVSAGTLCVMDPGISSFNSQSKYCDAACSL